MGLALLGVALWLREPPRGGALHLVAVVAMALVLFVCHLETLALFAFTVGCIELSTLHARWRARQLTADLVVRRSLRLAVPFLLAVAVCGADRRGHGAKPLLLQFREFYSGNLPQ